MERAVFDGNEKSQSNPRATCPDLYCFVPFIQSYTHFICITRSNWHVYMHIKYMHAHARVSKYACMRTCTHTESHSHTCTVAHSSVRTNMHTRTHKHTQAISVTHTCQIINVLAQVGINTSRTFKTEPHPRPPLLHIRQYISLATNNTETSNQLN